MADLAPTAVLERQNGYNPEAERDQSRVSLWNTRRDEARKDRRALEPTWHLCRQFLANRQWVGWQGNPTGGGRIVPLANPGDRERHTANVLTQYVNTAVGKISSEDFMPSLHFRREDVESEDFVTQARQALRYAWDEELAADRQIARAIRKMATYGTAALRVYPDRSKGEIIGELPVGPDGQPIYDQEAARAFVAEAEAMGQRVKFEQIRQVHTCWEPLGPFNLLPPPGVEYEENFPWLIVERPHPLTWIEQTYGKQVPEQQLASIDSLSAMEIGGDPSAPAPSAARLKGHAVVSVGYEFPTLEFPQGRTFIWSGQTFLAEIKGMPYELNGRPHHGIVFLRFHEIPERFWGMGMVEPGIGPQRQRNRARSQMIEMKDRNLGRVYAHKGTLTASNRPVGRIMEVIEVPLGHAFPTETNGVAPGPWIENEARMNDEDLDKVMGMRESSLGQAPGGVSAYSAMALLVEQDDKRLGSITAEVRSAVRDLTKMTLQDIRRYWPEEKQIALAGPTGLIDSTIFTASKLPTMIHVAIPKGTAAPRSPAAQIQLIFDLFNAATSSGKPLPVEWLYESIQQGQPMPIPRQMVETQRRQAELENALMMGGQMIEPNYWDDDILHIPVHRQQQTMAMQAGEEELAQMLEFHVQLHEQAAQSKSRGMMQPPGQNPLAAQLGGGGGGQTGPAIANPMLQGAQGAQGGRPPEGGPDMAALGQMLGGGA